MAYKFLLTKFRFIFWDTCVVFAIDSIKTCFDIYQDDASYSNTEYREFLSPHSPYPAISICLKKPYIEAEMKQFNVSNSQYMNPQFTEFYNLTYLYSMPYGKVTLNPKEKNFEFKIIVYVNENFGMKPYFD